MSDVRTFNLETAEWKYYPCIGRSITARRNHAAAVYDQTMYVYGGINQEGNYIDEVWTLNLSIYFFFLIIWLKIIESFTWNQPDIGGESSGPIASHRMCACYSDKNMSPTSKLKMKQKV